MALNKYVLRCRKKGILVTETPDIYDVVWIREHNAKLYPMDRQYKKKIMYEQLVNEMINFNMADSENPTLDSEEWEIIKGDGKVHKDSQKIVRAIKLYRTAKKELELIVNNLK